MCIIMADDKVIRFNGLVQIDTTLVVRLFYADIGRMKHLTNGTIGWKDSFR